MTAANLLTIIIPAYDAAAFIGQAIESVLAQDYRPIEVIVVDDGSNDATADIAERFGAPVICHRQANGGPPAARNRGLAMARGEYIGFLDADDLYEQRCLNRQVEKLRQNPGIDVVIGRLIREELDTGPGEPPRFKPVETEPQMNLQLGTGIFRRQVFERVGCMDESLRQSDDWDWFMRARELQVAMLLHDEIVLRQRLHLNNITRDRAANQHYLTVMLKRSLDRRRAGSGQAQSLRNLVSDPENRRQDGDAEK